MISERKALANRQNAALSTGPRSPEGKANSRANALCHGLTAGHTLVPGEDPAEFAGFRARLEDELAPVGVLERAFVESIAGQVWRLRRAGLIEASLLAWGVARGRAERSDPDRDWNNGDVTERVIREALRPFPSQRDPNEAFAAHQEDCASRDTPETLMGEVFETEAFQRSFMNLTRYEAGIERSLFRALHELQRLQAGRRGEVVVPPVAVEVQVHSAD